MSSEEDTVPATGQGTEPEQDSSEAARARRLANLRPPFKKGETGNPRGVNGRDKANEIVRFLEEPFDGDKTRFRRLLEAAFDRAVSGDRGSDQTIKTLVEYYAGRPKVQKDAVELPPNIDTNRTTLEVALDIYRERLLHGELGEDELLSVVQLLVGAEKAEAEMIARILGDRKGGPLKERAEALLSKLEARLVAADTQAPALPPAGTSAITPVAEADAQRSDANAAPPEAGTIPEDEPPKTVGER